MINSHKIIITQSNYIPWKGYFDSIAIADTFVVYDDMQYTKRDWRNRNKIVSQNSLKWLSIPVEVKGKYYQKINETKIADSSWAISHWSTLRQDYGKTAHFKEVKDWIEPLFLECNYKYLTEVNLHFIRAILDFFKINTNIKLSSEFTLAENKTQRLVDICKQLKATQYCSGPAAKEYMEESKFINDGINIKYFDYSGYEQYQQLSETFEHGVSILDLIFNEGSNAKNFLKLDR